MRTTTCGDEKKNFPVAARIALTDFYMDDLLIGANTKKQIFQLKEQMTIIKERGFRPA